MKALSRSLFVDLIIAKAYLVALRLAALAALLSFAQADSRGRLSLRDSARL